MSQCLLFELSWHKDHSCHVTTNHDGSMQGSWTAAGSTLQVPQCSGTDCAVQARVLLCTAGGQPGEASILHIPDRVLAAESCGGEAESSQEDFLQQVSTCPHLSMDILSYYVHTPCTSLCLQVTCAHEAQVLMTYTCDACAVVSCAYAPALRPWLVLLSCGASRLGQLAHELTVAGLCCVGMQR